ncbi:MAG: isochorismatase family cysteine hydrolase [Tissierellia bacterium]|nr:isochorismatase family cysteine hydrolase [Tissierellia bacterium]
MKKLLVVVDFQNDFVKGSLGFDGADKLDSIIVQKIRDYDGFDIVCTLDTHYENYLETNEGRNLPIEHCIKGCEGWEIYGKTGELLKEAKKFEKTTFGSLELADYVKENKYDEIEFVGLVTNICIISNAVIAKAASPESKIIIDADAVGSYDEEMAKKAIDIMKNLHMTILNEG